jgi:predicted NodU family carbamoyl transferase
MIILGLNAFHADSSAALVRDGVLLAAGEEELFCRIKHKAGFLSEAIRYCLQQAKHHRERIAFQWTEGWPEFREPQPRRRRI